MDLAEIRKKAQQQNPTAGNKVPPEQPPVVPESPAAAALAEYVRPGHCVRDEPAGALQRLFPGHEFATEEEYVQGLSGRDRSAELETVRWLTFTLGAEEYALSLEVVLELIKPRPYTDLPKVPDYVRGILSLRGEVVPVIDLRQRLNLGQGEADTYQRIIVCAGELQSIGLLVDRIIQVVQMPKAAIEPVPLVLNNTGKEFVAGVGRYQGRLLILLNPAEVLKI
jgi:purine-binding chemotaxis protein CheW